MKRFLFALLALFLGISSAFAQSDSGNATQIISASGGPTAIQVSVQTGSYFHGFTMGNTGAAAWLKVYDTGTIPTCGTTTLTPYIFPIPGNTALAGSNVALPFPIKMVNGIFICITGGVANNDTTTVSSGQVAGTVFWH